MIITIDGPSGSGKSTLAVKIAKHIHFMYLNSGYLYRGLTYVLVNFYGYDEERLKHIDEHDVQAILSDKNFEYGYQDGLARMYWIDDITYQLKDSEISRLSAYAAQDPFVRMMMHEFIIDLVKDHDVVIEGRACGSVLFPQAEVKFYLTATEQVRALRLQKDQMKRGNLMIMQEALAHILMRDKMDKERSIEPLVQPEGSILLDSSLKNPEELLQESLEYIKKEFKS